MTTVRNVLAGAACFAVFLLGPHADAQQMRQLPKGGARIIGGTEAPKGAYPFMVALINSRAADTQQARSDNQFCGGSVIKNKWVLTAAHCVTERDGRPRDHSTIHVYVGSNDFNGGERIKVKRTPIVHPKYDAEVSLDSDIAILELERAPSANKYKNIELVSTATEKEYGQAGTSVIAAGWGSIQAIRFRTEPKYDSKLRHAQMEILDRDLCDLNSKQALYTEVGQLLEMNLVDKGVRDKVMETLSLESLWRTQLTSNMICSGILKKAVDVCEGDSGGDRCS